MADLQGRERAEYVRRMFDRIARRYDLLNTLMTFGRDRAWRRETLQRLRLPPAARVLDIGAGTGDLSREARRRSPEAVVVAGDFAAEMLRFGRHRADGRGIAWLRCDAIHLPFAAATFDCVVSGFLLRNVADLEACLDEQMRVLRPGGRMASLDTTPVRPGPLRPLIEFHFRTVVPLLGRLFAGDAEAYNYLSGSTARFLPAESLAGKLVDGGFASVGFVRRMLGTIAIHWGQKPDDPSRRPSPG
jgi:demethylmenaquinone methyltransferase/2-methoxy-6-polyprenyl-1,4-benzoquinol methylase